MMEVDSSRSCSYVTDLLTLPQGWRLEDIADIRRLQSAIFPDAKERPRRRASVDRHD